MEALNRTTIGIRVPVDVQHLIEEALILIKRKPGVTDVRWNGASELVIAMCLLGELSPQTIARVAQVAAPICANAPRMRIELRGFGGLPNMIQPRYVYAALHGDVEWLGSLAAQLDHALTPMLPHRDVKPFHPHILLGRLKTESESNRVGLGRALKLADAPDMGVIQIDAVELLIASSSTSGIGYTVIDRMPLA